MTRSPALRLPLAAGALAACLAAAVPASRAADPAPAPAPAPAADPIVAKIGDETLRLSDVKAAAGTLPPQAHQMPADQLYGRLLDQMVDSRTLSQEAHKSGLDKDPDIQKSMHDVQERALVSAYLEREIGPRITDDAVKARFEKDAGSHSAEQEVHARHILVDDEATAKKIIVELKKGGDFAALSKQYSKDAAAVEQGGDLGYFKAADMVPEFSKAAFALKDKEVDATPVHTQFGWHVIQTLDHRTLQPVTYDKATPEQKNQLRQAMINEEVGKVLAKARADVPVERFNLDGSPIKATDSAAPPPAAK